MKDPNVSLSPSSDWFNPVGREQRIKDYIQLSNQLMWQRQASFLAAALLAAFYFDPIVYWGTEMRQRFALVRLPS